MSSLCSTQHWDHLSPHWDTDPIALNLNNGSPNSPKWAEGGALLINKLLTLNNKPIKPGDKFVQCKSGLQKLAYNVLMNSHYNLDVQKHMKERISTLFQPSVFNWNSIQFDSCISALQPFNSGNIMKVIKTWMNAWTTSSRMGGAHHIYPCLFGCSDVTDRLGHYIECPRLFTLWKYMHRNLSIHATKRWGLCSPSKSDIMHICCVFSAYHATSSHVKQNHELYGTTDQSKQLLISSQRRTWSSFAEAYDATARDFEICCPKYTLANIIQWHVSYEGNKFYNELEDLSQDPLILCLQPQGVLPEPGALPDSWSAPSESTAPAIAHVQPSASSSST